VAEVADEATRPVALTAQFTAKARAVESLRPDALFRDPWADRFAGRAGDAWLARQPPEQPGLSLVIRTRFFDDFLLRCSGQVVAPRQLVLLAAGYDTRAYRLEWPVGTRLYELDQPAVLARKDAILREERAQPRCERITLGLDLAQGWTEPLLASGFVPSAASIWLLEGLLMYLAADEAQRVVAIVTSLASAGSWLGFDLFNTATLGSPWTRQRVARLAARGMPWRFGLDEPAAWLRSFGWKAQVTTTADAGRRYGRWPYPEPPAAVAGTLPQAYLVTARRA
jgi:methyltransferase (TIGR00027 family)